MVKEEQAGELFWLSSTEIQYFRGWWPESIVCV